MRILFLSNYYPPVVLGGYEQLCCEVGEELTRRGHVVCVLTSRSPNATCASADNGVQVHRSLHLEVESGLVQTAIGRVRHGKQMARENLESLLGVVAGFRPDVALIWGMWNVSRSVPAELEHLLPDRVAYYLCDYWPSLPSAHVQQWQAPSRRGATRLAKWLVRRPAVALLENGPPIRLRFQHAACVSRATRSLLAQAGVPVDHASVIYLGIRTEEFASGRPDARRHRRAGALKLVYAGRLSSEKGVHTALRAMAALADRPDPPVTLDIVGRGDTASERELKAAARRHRLDGRVTFRGSFPRSEMPTILAHYDALVFPSEWEEPFAGIVLEAMVAGLVVIGTTTGGTGEVLIEGETGLAFPRGDAEALARQVRRLLDDSGLGRRLATAARQRVEEKFTLTHTVDQLEAFLQRIANGEKA
jgi:glycogen synthase